MLYYNIINISKRIDVDKSNNSKKCIICHYWFFNHGFEFYMYGCHDLTTLRLNIIDNAIITVKGVDYRCIIHEISKSEAIHLKLCT